MSWGMRRRLLIFGMLFAVVALVVGSTFYLGAHKAPTCTDNKQNQSEEGVDCGGPCQYLCTASEAAPSVRFVRPLSPSAGRTDVIAYVDNPNSDAAATALPYTIELYGPTNTVIARGTGTLDLPPGSTVPVFKPNFFSGSEQVARAFLTFTTPEHFWYSMKEAPSAPSVRDVRLTDGTNPRIDATAVNATPTALRNTVFIVTVFDAAGTAIAASQTIAPVVPANGTAILTFTWSAPFIGTVSRIDVVPLPMLPSHQ